MSTSALSRRHLLGLASAASAGVVLSPMLSASPARAQSIPAGLGRDAESLLHSIESAFTFQDLMMDAYASGSTVRLSQSYSDGGLETTGFTYDNAVAIHAYLASGRQDLLDRAEILGAGLLYAQATNFPVHDGRFAQAYFTGSPNPDGSGAYITPASNPFYFYGSAVGDQAWAGMALTQLYARTRNPRYLEGALAVANWIVTNTYSTLGAGGFSFGTAINQFNQSVPSTNGKSTEHNIDTFAFFTMLARETHNGRAANHTTWSDLAQHALTFVLAMYNPDGPYFYTGTLGDQITINPYPIPEDCQTWSYMALLDNDYRATIDWALAHLQTTDTAAALHSSLTGTQRIHGLVFDTASLAPTLPNTDPHAVWLEGTAHTAAALIARVLRGGDGLPKLFEDISEALRLLQQCEKAQTILGAGQTIAGRSIPLGLGLVAATSLMDTGFSYTYGNSLHIGATGWYLLAAQGANPFQLGYRVLG